MGYVAPAATGAAAGGGGSGGKSKASGGGGGDAGDVGGQGERSGVVEAARAQRNRKLRMERLPESTILPIERTADGRLTIARGDPSTLMML